MAFLKHDGRTVCYRLLGDSNKPLLMLAHPLGMTQGVWDDMLPALLRKISGTGLGFTGTRRQRRLAGRIRRNHTGKPGAGSHRARESGRVR